MALLQIAEPGQSPQPHQRRLAVGIDLGTTNSLVAALRSGLSEPLADGEGQVILPSVVRYHADRVEVGQSAKSAAA
ncbi:Hsp70 family protein, partial [Pseudomonas sp.]|uniref:Hsp70 family protein n=2 Tax=unclassified Pseudomonas TaxID=196821 RepID=UPI003FD721A6